MPTRLTKKSIGIICNSNKLFLSLKRAISLFAPKGCLFFFDTSTTDGQFDLASMQETAFRRRLRNCRLIIAIAYRYSEPSKIVRLIHHLRGDFAWEGSFLVIVNDEKEKNHLMEVNVIGENSERFQFGHLPGHAAIYLPFLLTDAIHEIAELEDMYIEVWDSIVNGSLVGDISTGINRAAEFVKNNDTQNALAVVCELLQKMRQVDWLTWLRDPHEDLPVVNNFIEMYPPERPMDKDNCSTVIDFIQGILLRSFIRNEDSRYN